MFALRRGAFAPAVFLASLFLSCSSEDKPGKTPGAVTPVVPQPEPTTLFSPAIKQVYVEIDYAPGAEPYTGSAGNFRDVWRLFRTSLTALFEGRKDVSFPTRVADMQALEEVTQTAFTTDDIVNIANTHRDYVSEGELVTFYVVFLNGYFEDDTGIREEILGVSIGRTGIMALFKPAIASTAVPETPFAQYVEQATLIHEFGHAVGFVNNGIPINTPHHDAENGAHCTNTDCVMYYAHETTTAAVDFVRRAIITSDPVLYGQECLSDVRILENEGR
jgi:hypothetical protein